jgi:hypothetical protein
MKSEKISKAPVTTAGEDKPVIIGSLEEIMALGTPVGTWGGSTDILLRVRNLKPVAADKIGSTEETMARGTVLGIFGGSTEIVFRSGNWKPVAANVGDQGGGQN